MRIRLLRDSQIAARLALRDIPRHFYDNTEAPLSLCCRHRLLDLLGLGLVVVSASAWEQRNKLRSPSLILAQQHGIETLNIVRKDDHIVDLKTNCGANYVFNTDYDCTVKFISSILIKSLRTRSNFKIFKFFFKTSPKE